MDESTSWGEPTTSTVSGQRIGSYRVVQSLGCGGMSSVFRAVHEETGNEVALKVLTRSLARNSTLLQRFMREARSAETLEHQNIVTIFDRGIDRGRHYLVLEYVAGGDFHEYIQRRGPLSTAEAISVVKSVASGLRYAASRGLIHRDVKPSNILRTPAGVVKIIDLGLAIQNAFEDERVTREGTTVGTVDYMAPEQARDSRATSIQSDIYSLGCTFYYFLTGFAAYPGGDITDKLTRHARAPIPDVRDLRPDVPQAIGSILRRMMAKKADDRFASYDDLIAALDAASTEGSQEVPGIALVPLADEMSVEPPPLATFATAEPASGDPVIDEPESSTLPVASLAQLAGERSGEVSTRQTGRSPAAQPAPPLPRHGVVQSDPLETDSSEIDELAPIPPSPATSSATAWIVAVSCVVIAVLLLAIGIIEVMDSPSSARDDVVTQAEPDVAVDPPNTTAPVRRIVDVATPSSGSSPPAGQSPEPKTAELSAHPWVEPPDVDPPRRASATRSDALGGVAFLPDWARIPVRDRIDGNFVVVRRVAGPNDASTVPTLYMALDQKIGGTVEIADEGPFFNDDFRVAGNTRLIRARSGYRPIVRIERSSSEVVRKQPAVFVVDHQNLTLDGIDLVLDVRDIYPEQTALFSCAESTLTLINCSITVLNRNNAPFSVVRVEPRGSKPSRVRLEKTFVRGTFSAAVTVAGGSTDLVLDKSVIVGGPGPLVRVASAASAPETRLFFASSFLVGPGPIIERSGKERMGPAKPLSITAFGSTFGRLRGKGVASVISSSSSAERATRQIQWRGDNNGFAGWMGFFACGSDPEITIPDLAEVRSTWNGVDRESQEYLSSWLPPADLALATLNDFKPFFPIPEKTLWQAAQPRDGLFEKAVGEYLPPTIPQPVGWAFEPLVPPGNALPARQFITAPRAVDGQSGMAVVTPPSSSAGTPLDPLDLDFNTAAPPWDGDLGAFLRDRLPVDVRHARVRVIGSGQHRFTPVRLPRDLWLEIRVDPLAAAEPPSWWPEPTATGAALIELKGGALVLSDLILCHAETSRLEHLISVEDGHLVLSRCQFTAPGSSSDFTGDLIAFRSPSTKPDLVDTGRPVFATPVDRPVCRLHESILITGGTALTAELGRGMVALTECAIAAGVTGIELRPSKVSRQRFKDADLVMDHCTLTSERSIVRVGPWPGRAPGPARPWLITSRNCAFLAMYDRKTRDTVLLRADADALARGTVSWQASNDAADVDFFTAAGEGVPVLNRPRDLQLQWTHFWGPSHISGRMTGPRESRAVPSVKFWEKLRPGRVEPIDLLLVPDYHPDRERLNVGADLGWLGKSPQLGRFGRLRN